MMQSRNCLRKLEIGIEVRVLVAAAVASPPTGIQSKLHEVCKPRLSAGTSSGAARQSAELIQIDWLRAFRDQICVQEILVSELILGIVMDVLGHVPIQDLQGFGVGWIPSSARELRCPGFPRVRCTAPRNRSREFPPPPRT